MSHPSNDNIYERAAEVLYDCNDATREIIERCLDNDDLDGLHWVLAHLPEEQEQTDVD